MTELEKLFAIKRTQVQMMYDRGYQISESEVKYLMELFDLRLNQERDVRGGYSGRSQESTERSEEDFSLTKFRTVNPQEALDAYYTFDDFLNDHSNLINQPPFKELHQSLSHLYRRPLVDPNQNGNGEFLTETALVWFVPEDSQQNELVNQVATQLLSTIEAVTEDEKKQRSRLTVIITISAKNWKKSALEPFKLYGSNFQHFLESELTYNPTLHIFVPPHRRMSKSEKEEFLSRNRFEENQLPRMRFVDTITQIEEAKVLMERKVDPIVKYYDFRPGDLIEIRRTNIFVPSMVSQTKFWRIVDY